MFELKDIGAAAFVVARRGGVFRYEDVNAAVEHMTGLSRHAILDRTVGDLFAPEIAETLSTSYGLCMDEGRTVEIERILPLPAGELAIRITLTPLFDDPTEPVWRLLGVSVDITEQFRLQESLKTANARLAIAMEALGGAHWYYDASGRAFELSSAFERFLGIKVPLPLAIDEWLGHVHPEDREDTCFADILAGRSEQGTAEFRILSNTGEVRWLRCRRQAIVGDGIVTGIAGMVLDITQEKRREDTLRFQATSDPLTGLANRRRFEEVLAVERDRAAARHGAMALLMIDVDHFKSYNDTYGHLAGDAVLRRLSACLTGVVTALGGTAARYGGEEFVVVLPGVDSSGGAQIASRILESIETLAIPHARSPRDVVSVSIGVSGHAGTLAGGVDIVALADAALYRAKNDGRACFCVMPALQLQAVSLAERSSAA